MLKMPPRCSAGSGIFLPFLYPSFFRSASRAVGRAGITTTRHSSSLSASSSPSGSDTSIDPSTSSSLLPSSRLNPPPDDYAITAFADKARVTVYAGPGGHGCISFLREAFVAEGPANGGDGGHGGNVYVQAVRSETSLHKLVRRRILRAGRGKSGQGSSRGGARGDDIIIQVPVGTVVRELSRVDPVVEERARYREARQKEREYEKLVKEREMKAEAMEAGGDEAEGGERRNGRAIEELIRAELPEPPEHPNSHKFLLYPGMTNSDRQALTLPRVPRRERLYVQPDAPIHLDLSEPTKRPILIAAGGIGGLGNPHFVSKDRPRPLFATKGESAVSLQLELELKLLADVGLVGLPNAGKSTLLRALTNSRARVGNWAFTTLQPNIGTVVLDNHKGRPIPTPKPMRPQHAVIHDATYGSVVLSRKSGQIHDDEYEPRTRFTVADIPGLIEGAHLDRGLGVEFLRHVERAGVLAFVVDLGAGDAVAALKSLWAEVGLYARMREEEEQEREMESRIDWEGDGSDRFGGQQMIVADMPGPSTGTNEGGLYIAAKPWFVIATKGDLPGTEDNYARLKEYLKAVTERQEPHPSGVEKAWVEDCAAIPVSAIHGHGVDRIIHWTVGLLDGER